MAARMRMVPIPDQDKSMRDDVQWLPIFEYYDYVLGE